MSYVVCHISTCCDCFATQVKANFLDTFYAGQHCGITVLTMVVLVEKFMLYHTVAVPIAESLNHNGIPTLYRQLNFGNECVAQPSCIPSLFTLADGRASSSCDRAFQ
jgi:hypothetical protein